MNTGVLCSNIRNRLDPCSAWVVVLPGASFATLPPAYILFDQMYANGTCPSSINAEGVTVKGPCPEAYGALLGTMMLCSLWEIGLSFVPSKQLKKVFPPVVTGLVIV
jgi:xanthine/uracil permease